MALIVTQISATGASNSWVTLPTPVELKPSTNALDSAKTGRDSTSGTMHRDLVAVKGKWSIAFPSGLTNTQVATLHSIMMAAKFYIKIPCVSSGQWETKTVYCSSFSPEIENITAYGDGESHDEHGNLRQAEWTYKGFEVSIIEF